MKVFKDRQGADLCQFKERQQADFNAMNTEEGAKLESLKARAEHMRTYLEGTCAKENMNLGRRIEQQEEELSNSLILERSWVKLVETGLVGLKKALIGGVNASKGYMMAVLKMQEAMKSDDLDRMKSDILDAEVDKEVSFSFALNQNHGKSILSHFFFLLRQ